MNDGSGAAMKLVCNLCGTDTFRVVYDAVAGAADDELGQDYKITAHAPAVPFRITRCLRCGLIFANPLPDFSQMAQAYSTMRDDEYLAEEQGRRATARAILRQLRRMGACGRLLDIGCSAGFLIDEAARKGWAVHGVELSQWGVQHTRNVLNLPGVFEGSLHEAAFPDRHFDAVVLKDTIEHLFNPLETLREVWRITRPGGIVCINTPNIDSLVSRVLRAQWWGVKRSHLFYFTRATLRAMAIKAAFQPECMRAHGRTFTVDYWLTRLASYNQRWRVLTDLVRRFPAITRMRFYMNIGDQIELYARKPHQEQ